MGIVRSREAAAVQRPPLFYRFGLLRKRCLSGRRGRAVRCGASAGDRTAQEVHRAVRSRMVTAGYFRICRSRPCGADSIFDVEGWHMNDGVPALPAAGCARRPAFSF